MKSTVWTNFPDDRRRFLGGTDARIIMGADREASLRLWREKRGEAEPQDYSEESNHPAWGSHRGPQSALVQANRGGRSSKMSKAGCATR